jgi:adenosylmethionine-8-amino-7-oxononanoate aminotransferase
LTIVHGQGVEVTDDQGRRYLDAQAGYSGASCGYGVPSIKAAVVAQAEKIAHYPLGETDTLPARRLARQIAALCPPDLRHVFFCSSGSEAVEAAMKIARLAQRLAGHQDRRFIVTLPAAYHGATMSALAASDIALAREGFDPFPDGFLRVDANGQGKLASAIAKALDDDEGRTIAGVLLEPVRGVGGVHPLAPGELKAIGEICRAQQVLLLVDEVMTGFGRTGRWFAYQHEDVIPDLVIMSKGMTGGYAPLAAVAARSHVFERFAADPVAGGLRHGHTSSGHALSCAAALATIDEIQRRDLVASAAAVGGRMLDRARSALTSRLVADVRGLGLLIGVELRTVAEANAVRGAAREHGLLLRGQRGVLTLAPPLCIDDDKATMMVDILEQSCREVEQRLVQK